MTLAEEHCVPIGAGSVLASPAEAAALRPAVGAWSVVDDGRVSRLERAFRFGTFAQALAFTNAVGEAAEEEGHHPRIVTEWGSVTVQWWTRALGGLHRNDFIMAARADAIAARGGGATGG